MENSQIIDAAKLVEQKQSDILWLLDGVIPAGGLVLMAGETSSGKSLLALELALAVALGACEDFERSEAECEANSKTERRAWGLPCALRGKVRYLCADADRAELARRVGRLCAGHSIDVPRHLSFDFGRHVFDDTHLDTLQKAIKREGIRLIIVDPLSRYLPWMNDNSMRSVGTGLQTMRDLASKTGATIVMLQGFNKRPPSRSNKYGQPITDGSERVRGSSELVASCDVSLLVTRGNTRNTIELIKNRQGRTPWASYFSIVDGPDPNPVKKTTSRAALANSSAAVENDLFLSPMTNDRTPSSLSTTTYDLPPALHIVFEKTKPVEVKPPNTLAELVERRFKKVMRREPRRQFSREELISETKKLIGDVGKRSLANAFSLLGKDEAIKVVLGEQHRKLYGLAMPVKAFYDRVLEEEGELAALDMLSKKLSVDAPLLLLEEKFKEREESRKSIDQLDEIIEKLRGGVA